MRFDMTFDVTLRDDSSFGKLSNSCIKNVSFSLLLVTFSITANFEKEYLWKSIYLRFPGSFKPSSSICYVLFSSEEKYCGALLLFHKIPLKLNCYTVYFKLRVLPVFLQALTPALTFTLKLLA